MKGAQAIFYTTKQWTNHMWYCNKRKQHV